MVKKLFHVVCLASMIFVSIISTSCVLHAAPVDVIFGPKTQGNRIPWWGRKYDSITSQHLYMQSDIATYGNITSFAWENYLLIEDMEGNYNNVLIYMGHTSRTTLGTVLADNYTGSRELVFSRTSFNTGGPTDTWNEIVLDTPFEYNNRDNLLIEVRWRDDDDHSVLVWCGYWTGHGARTYAFTDTATTGSVDDDYVYRIKLHFEDAGQPTPTPTVTTLYSPTPTTPALPASHTAGILILTLAAVPLVFCNYFLRL